MLCVRVYPREYCQKKIPSVLALWPFILEKVHKDSVTEIYQLQFRTDHWDEDIERRNNTSTDEDERSVSKEEYEFLMEYYDDEACAYENQLQEEKDYDPAEEKRQYSELIESKKDASVVLELLRRNAKSPPFNNILL